MKYAVDRYSLGNETEVNADDFDGKAYIPGRRSRFFCPECGEIVFFRAKGGSHPNQFFHQEKTESTPECDKRVDGRSELSLNQRVGLPLYLTGILSDHYQLSIGFPALGAEMLQKAAQAGYTVEISSGTHINTITYVKTCPFCGKDSVQEKKILKPWGFAPIAGRKQNGLDDDGEISFAEDPSYSITPAEEEMIDVVSFRNLRYSKRSDDPLIILNKGPASKGFMVCKDCGAAVPGDDDAVLGNIMKPYVHPHKHYFCNHPASRIENTYLGNQFRTDMVVYEISLDNDEINVDSHGLWIHRAGQTLADAMTLAGGRLLDIEFNEINSGYRLRYSAEHNKTFVDVFLFDSLSSGAGYCSALADRTEELMEETRNVLMTCPAECDSACHECLMHYWNQRVHAKLDRFAALDLLDWCQKSKLPDALSYEKQEELLIPLNHLGSDYIIESDGVKHYVKYENKHIRVILLYIPAALLIPAEEP